MVFLPGLLTAMVGAWGTLALTYSGPHNDAVRYGLAVVFADDQLHDQYLNIWLISRVNSERMSFSWKIFASGYVPELMYEHGRLDTGGLTFSELQQRPSMPGHRWQARRQISRSASGRSYWDQ